MTKPQYGAKHQSERAKWKRIVEAGGASCCLCGQPITAGDAWDLDHQPGTSTYRGVAHAFCNRSEGVKHRERMKASNAGPWRL